MYYYPQAFVPPPPGVAPKPFVPNAPSTSQTSESSTENTVDLIVYIGNLPIKLSNEAAINILQKCGPLTHWRRQSDPTNDTFATFGFCQFADCQGAHNAMTLLAGLELQKKPIKVSCNDKVKYQLAGWLAKREAHLLDHPEDESGIKAAEAAVKKDLQGLLAEQDILLERESRRLKALYDDRLKRRESAGSESMELEESKKKKRHEERPECDYLSKEYKVHWKESERLGRVKQRERDSFATFIRIEREWLREEERIFKNLERKREFMGLITERDRERAIREDSTSDCILDRDSIRRIDRERRLDIEDYEDELKFLENERLLQSKEEIIKEKVDDIVKEEIKECVKECVKEDVKEDVSGDIINEKAIDEKKGVKEDRPKMVQKLAFVPKVIRDSPPKRPIPVIDVFNTESKSRLDIQDPRVIMSRVPKDVDEVFGYRIDWGVVESQDIVNGKLKPWIKRRIMSYMEADGSVHNQMDQQILVEVVNYIVSKIIQYKNPKMLLEDVIRFLDSEAMPFVLGLWRLLIFQTNV